MNNLLNGFIILAVLITLALSIVSLVLPCKKSSFGDDTTCKKLQNDVNCSVGEQCCSGYCNFSSTPHTKCVGDGKSKWCQCMASPPAPPPGPSPGPSPGPPGPSPPPGLPKPKDPPLDMNCTNKGKKPYSQCSGIGDECCNTINNDYICSKDENSKTNKYSCMHDPNTPWYKNCGKDPKWDSSKYWCCEKATPSGIEMPADLKWIESFPEGQRFLQKDCRIEDACGSGEYSCGEGKEEGQNLICNAILNDRCAANCGNGTYCPTDANDCQNPHTECRGPRQDMGICKNTGPNPVTPVPKGVNNTSYKGLLYATNDWNLIEEWAGDGWYCRNN